MDRHTDAKFATPAKNFSLRFSGLMAKMLGAKNHKPVQHKDHMRMEEIGETFNMFNKVASEAQTLSSGLKRCRSLTI